MDKLYCKSKCSFSNISLGKQLCCFEKNINGTINRLNILNKDPTLITEDRFPFPNTKAMNRSFFASAITIKSLLNFF